MNTHYSRYADLPADRDYERIRDELRALPSPATEAAGRTSALRSWLGRHVHHSSRMPLGHPRRA